MALDREDATRIPEHDSPETAAGVDMPVLRPLPSRDDAYVVTVTNEYATGPSGWIQAARSLVTGLGITARLAARKPGTIRYPEERVELSPRWRGALRLKGVLGRDEIPLLSLDPPAHNRTIDELYAAGGLAPCTGNCPANVDARGQNLLAAENRLVEAYELVRERNVMPGVLGRICHHPCETACVRSRYDQPIAIRPLHRIVAEEYAKVRDEHLHPLPRTRPETVAIIGSGPSGLAAALDLMRLGYGVTVFEKDETPGGALNSGVPAYRLPRELLHAEIGDLVKMGLDLRLGVEIGPDVPMDHLIGEFDAVLIAAGLQDSRILPLPGTDAKGVIGAIEFLRGANFRGDAGVAGKRVLTIGGGNVAVDVARCALRVGATESRLACLESEDEMPCHPWEIEEGVDEGVIAQCGLGPVEVLAEKGRVVGMRMRECLSVFDSGGRFSPQYSDSHTDIPCDVVVFAIGQAPRLRPIAAGTDLMLDDRGALYVDGQLLTTPIANVFACGEVVTGPGSAIASIATGHEAAVSIHRFLNGQDVAEGRVARPLPVYPKYAPADLEGVEHDRLRAEMPMAAPALRVTDFRPVELGFTHREGVAEAQRCLRCSSGVCVGCTFCARVCPDYAIKVRRVDDPGGRCLTRYDLDLSKCCFCGLCAEQCPTGALEHTGQYELAFFHRDLTIFDKGEMLRDPGGTRATGRDGIDPPVCGGQGSGAL